MNRRDDPLDNHLATLVRLRERAGADVYRRAVEAARVAVGRVVLAEAERLAGVGRRRRRGAIILRFPIGRRFLPPGGGIGGPESGDRRDDS
jgi:hypothetical protein